VLIQPTQQVVSPVPKVWHSCIVIVIVHAEAYLLIAASELPGTHPADLMELANREIGRSSAEKIDVPMK
jgi:hypothetical protein